jgi:hypothetical protein
MVDRPRQIMKGKNGLYYRVEFGSITVSNGDTVTFDMFHATTSPLTVYFFKKVDATLMTCDYATGTNETDIIGAGSNIPCFYFAYGVLP